MGRTVFREFWNGKNNSCGNNRTCKRPSSGFVESCNEAESCAQEPLFKEIHGLVKWCGEQSTLFNP